MSIFEHLEGFISGNVNLAKSCLSLIKLETRLAGLSIYPLILNVCMLLVVLSTLWLTATAFMIYGAALLMGNLALAFISVLLLNLVLLGILMKYLMFNLRKMSFEKTRELFSKKKRPDYDELENASTGEHNTSGAEVSNPAN